MLSPLGLFNYEPYYAIKPVSVLSPLILVMDVLGDPYVPVLCYVLVTYNAPEPSYIKEPLFSPFPFVGNRDKSRPFPFVGYRVKFFKPLTSPSIAKKKTLKSCFRLL